MRVCIAQINYRSQNIHDHLDRIENIISLHRECDLIVFPELIVHGHPSFEKPEGFLYRRMKVVYGSASSRLHKFIQEQNARVIIGESQRRGDQFYNVATYVDKASIQSYAKTHVHWTENFAPGNKLKIFDTPVGKIGITICFDSAFSEVWRVLALTGAPIIVNIAAVPKEFPVRFLWRRLRGAALNNQVFVIYVNRPGEAFAGHSAVFDPCGDLLLNAGPHENIVETEIDPAQVTAWRTEEMIYPYRRPLLYREIARRWKPAIPLQAV